MGAGAIAVAAAIAGAPRASAAQAPPAGLGDLWRTVKRAVDRAVDERSRRPPVPVAVRWRERRLASLDLGAPLLAIAAADLDGDGRAELAALTTRDVVVLSAAGPGLRELGRAPLPGDPATPRPRDPVGALVVDSRHSPAELVVRSSERARSAVFVWRGGALAEIRQADGFPLCSGATVELAPGRNTFDAATARWEAEPAIELPPAFFAATCRDRMIDPQGRSMSVAAVVDVERVLRFRCRAADGECPAGAIDGRDYTGVGVAFEIADIDNDGRPEVLTTRGGAPGDRDRVSVYSRRGERTDRVFAKDFHAGVVGLTAGDVDGDGDRDVIVAVRFAGSSHVSFWTLN